MGDIHLIDPALLDDHIRMIMNTFFVGQHIAHKNKYNFRCNVCGDSKKSKKKKRAWILKDKDPWMFHCFNGCQPIPAEHWMKVYFPAQYESYIRSLFQRKLSNKPAPVVQELPQPAPVYNDFQDTQYFIPILDKNHANDPIFISAIFFCNRRYIPVHVWHRWYVAVGGRFDKRLVIPFYDNQGKIYSYQGRTLIDEEPKYMGKVEGIGFIYNWYNIDRNQPVQILEGPIDSDFVVNSIALTGTSKIGHEDVNKLPFRRWFLDNDKDGKAKSAELLKKGELVFIWHKFLRERGIAKYLKDVNDYIIYCGGRDKLTYNELKPYYSSSLFDSIYLE
jgi:hypothetical protein